MSPLQGNGNEQQLAQLRLRVAQLEASTPSEEEFAELQAAQQAAAEADRAVAVRQIEDAKNALAEAENPPAEPVDPTV